MKETKQEETNAKIEEASPEVRGSSLVSSQSVSSSIHRGQTLPRPTAAVSAMLNSGLSEELVRKPHRSIVSGYLKDSALRSVSSLLSENGKPMNVAIDEKAKHTLDELMNEFLTDVVQEACRLTKRRKTNFVNGHDLGIVLNKRYGLNVPGSNCGAVLPVHPHGAVGSEHARRMIAVRKMNSQTSKPRKQNVYNST